MPHLIMVSVVQASTKWQWKKRIVFALCASVLLSQSNIQESKASENIKVQKIRNIQVEKFVSPGCYKWSDQVILEEKMNSPVPPIYKALGATKTSCKEVHQFEIYSAIPSSVTKKTSSQNVNSGKYCSKLYKSKKKFSVIASPEVWPILTISSNSQKSFWCAVTGPTYKDSSNNSFIHFESIYFPEFKINARS